MMGLRDFARQGMRFGTVGVGATLTYVLVSTLSSQIGLAPYIANAAGYGVGTVFSYLGHFRWTFGKRGGHARHLSRFLVLTASGFLLSNVIVTFVVNVLDRPFWMAVAVIVLTVPFATWMGGRYWAFR